jgi:monoamine oxidase
MGITRRAWLAAAAALPLAACDRRPPPGYAGGWVGAAHDRGHRLRESRSGALPPPAVQRRAGVLIVGAGVAGLACARSLAARGIDDVHLLELEDTPGGNSRGHQLGGMRCPLGAHYLPLPGDEAHEVIDLLTELGVCRTEHGKRVYDERFLCHSPQERVFVHGQWQEGLLPFTEDAATLDEYRRFSADVTRLTRELGFSIPTFRSPWTAGHQALDALTFAAWLDAQAYRSADLRTYLDYCCRDDYGAGLGQVSAWAGLHYFASRHGFHAPGEAADSREGVLTWADGNAWLVERLAAPFRERTHGGQVVLRVSEGKSGVEVDAWNPRSAQMERWSAAQVVMAVPLFIAVRLLSAPPAALTEAAATLRYAPWLVANLQLDAALDDPPGAAPAWDNVIHGSALLGYVDAMHQSTRPHAGPTVLTSYWALGGDSAEQLRAQRGRLLSEPWQLWSEAVVNDLSTAHPDLRDKLRQVDLMRYGHAMSVPSPGVRGHPALRALAEMRGKVRFAHADLSGYSVFEEAFTHGHRAGLG